MENFELFNTTKVSKAYINLSIPLVLSMIVTLIYNLADTFFVARTGNTDLVAGVSLGVPLFTALMAMGNIAGQGGSSLISRLIGQNDRATTRKVSSFCFYGTLVLGIVAGSILLSVLDHMLWLLGASPETFAYAREYCLYLSIGSPFIMLSFIHSNLLRAEGMSKESMTGTILGAIVNILLDPVLISLLGWGASGAAIATVIGYISSDLYFLIIVKTKSKILSINPRDVRIKKEHAANVIAVGIPSSVVNIMQSLSAVLMNQFLLLYGDEKIAAMGIAMKVSMIALLLITGLAFGGQPLFGYFYGAGNSEKLRELLHFVLKFILTISAIITILIIIFAPVLMRVFMDNRNIIEDGTLMLRLQVITMPLVAVILLITIIFQAMGKALSSFIISISRQGIVFAAMLVIGSIIIGYYGIIASQAASDVITLIIALSLLLREKELLIIHQKSQNR